MSYTTSNAFLSSGVTLSYATSSGGSYTTIGEITDVTEPKDEFGKVKVTNMQSLNKRHEYIPGFADGGDFEASVNMTDTVYQALQAIKGVAPQFFKIVWNNPVATAGSTQVCQGFLASCYAIGSAPDKQVEAKIKITITGKPTYTAAV